MSDATTRRTVESMDGWFEVTVDDVGNGYQTYTVVDRDTGYEYTARYDEGWRIAPRGHATVDVERIIGNTVQALDPELDGLVMTLNLIRGGV